MTEQKKHSNATGGDRALGSISKTEMGLHMQKNENKKMKLAQLSPSPLQGECYSACTPAENEALRLDMDENGQRDPIHVMPRRNRAGWAAHAILDGHRRFEAAISLGWSEIDVVVRWDLVDADATEVEAAFLRFNLIRRHLHPLDHAAIALRLFKSECGVDGDFLRGGRQEREARERIGAEMGWSGRHLLRMFRILLTPRAVQLAVRNGHLPVVMAEKIESLKPDVQAKIAEAIADLHDSRAIQQIVRGYLRSRQMNVRKPNTKAAIQLIRAIADRLAGFDATKVYGPDLAPHKQTLETAAATINLLIEAVNRPSDYCDPALADLLHGITGHGVADTASPNSSK